MKLLNAISLNMLPQQGGTLKYQPISIDEARDHLRKGFVSAIGHSDTANVLSNLLQLPVPANRITVSLQPGETAIVAQYRGPRLPEGATTLPEGAVIDWYLVQVE